MTLMNCDDLSTFQFTKRYIYQKDIFLAFVIFWNVDKFKDKTNWVVICLIASLNKHKIR